MLHRWISIGIVFCWMIANTWLVWHDIVPAWTAQNPPAVVDKGWVDVYGQFAHFGIYDDEGHKVGGIWTEYISSAASTDRTDDIYLNDLHTVGPMCTYVKSVFDVDGCLDEIDIAVQGAWETIRITGQRFPGQFAFKVDAGVFKHVFKIELSRAGKFAAAFRPFDAMPNLTVGQSWRVQVFNPIAAVTGFGQEFVPMMVTVTGREMATFDGEERDCLIIESAGARAWVDRVSGVVYQQDVDIPVIGSYSIKLEEYDARELRDTRRKFEYYRKTVLENSANAGF